MKAWLSHFFIVFLSSTVLTFAQTSPVTTILNQCQKIGGVVDASACVNIVVDSHCVFNVTVTVGGMKVLQQQFVGALPRELCAKVTGICNLCLRFNDMTSSSGCVSVVLNCLGTDMQSQQLGCFSDIPQLGGCVQCKNDCSGHGTCDNAICHCASGWSGDDCSTAQTAPSWRQCIDTNGAIPVPICVELSFSICAITLSIIEGDRYIYQRPIQLSDLELDPASPPQFCQAYLGCELCLTFQNFNLTTTNGRPTATGCPSLSLSCFGASALQYPLGCFTDNMGIVRNCAYCPNNCTSASQGTCQTDTGKCACKAGWSGSACDVKSCDDSDQCNSHGTCVQGQCVCAAGWNGQGCSLECATSPGDRELVAGELTDNQKMKVGETWYAYISTNPDVAYLQFSLYSRDGAQDWAGGLTLRRSCHPTPLLSDATSGDLLNVLSTATSPLHLTLLDGCPSIAETGGRWYIALHCSACRGCKDQSSCTFGIRVVPHYIVDMDTGSTRSNQQLESGERSFYVIHFQNDMHSKDDLVINITQTYSTNPEVTDGGVAPLAGVTLQYEKCPLDQVYLYRLTQPNRTVSDPMHQQATAIFTFALDDPRNGDYFVRIDAPAVDKSFPGTLLSKFKISASETSISCSNGCSNGGTCIGENKCQCKDGWEGDDCSLPICKTKCNHGTCAAPELCKCDSPQWTGQYCNVSTHQSPSSGSGFLPYFIGAMVTISIVIIIAGAAFIFWYMKKKRVEQSNFHPLQQLEQLEPLEHLGEQEETL